MHQAIHANHIRPTILHKRAANAVMTASKSEAADPV